MFSAEGYEIVHACWTAAGDANKPAALTRAIGSQTSDINQSTFMRLAAGATPVVPPDEWWGRCDASSNSPALQYVPRDYITNNVEPFAGAYCVADYDSGTTGVVSYDYFDKYVC